MFKKCILIIHSTIPRPAQNTFFKLIFEIIQFDQEVHSKVLVHYVVQIVHRSSQKNISVEDYMDIYLSY